MPNLSGSSNTLDESNQHGDCGPHHPKARGKIMTKVIIELEFETDDITEADVINYLNELIDNDCLAFDIVEPS